MPCQLSKDNGLSQSHLFSFLPDTLCFLTHNHCLMINNIYVDFHLKPSWTLAESLPCKFGEIFLFYHMLCHT